VAIEKILRQKKEQQIIIKELPAFCHFNPGSKKLDPN